MGANKGYKTIEVDQTIERDSGNNKERNDDDQERPMMEQFSLYTRLTVKKKCYGWRKREGVPLS